MALMDKFLELSDAQNVTTGATTSTNIVDLGAANLAVGAGTPMWLNIRIQSRTAGSVTGTCTFSLTTAAAEAFSSRQTIWSSEAISQTTLAAGYSVIRMPIPHEAIQRYLGLTYTVGSSAISTLEVNAWIELAAQSNVGA